MEKLVISYKSIGANVIVVIDGQQFSKKTTKEERETIKAEVEKYNKKNTDKVKNGIIKLLTPVTIEKKKVEEKEQVKAKAEKQLVKKDIKKEKVVKKEETNFNIELAKLVQNGASPEEVQKLVNQYKEKVETNLPVAKQTPTPRRGEY